MLFRLYQGSPKYSKIRRYLLRSEHVLHRPVVCLADGFGELLVGSYPGGEAVEGGTGAKGDFAETIGTFERRLS